MMGYYNHHDAHRASADLVCRRSVLVFCHEARSASAVRVAVFWQSILAQRIRRCASPAKSCHARTAADPLSETSTETSETGMSYFTLCCRVGLARTAHQGVRLETVRAGNPDATTTLLVRVLFLCVRNSCES